MAAERYNGVSSDTEAQEKPVREQLKKASISKVAGAGSAMAGEEGTTASEDHGENGDTSELTETRGRLQRKRSFEEVEEEQVQHSRSQSARHHTRKRSRDGTVEENELNNGQRKSGERSREDGEADPHAASNGEAKASATERPRTPEQTGDKRGEAAVEAMTSPKPKKSRLHSTIEENGAPVNEAAPLGTKEAPLGSITDREKVIPSTESKLEEKATSKIPPTTGFANTSVSSPFASIRGSKSPSQEPPQKSSGTFAASGFGSLSSSSASAFGAIGKNSGGFGAGGGFATGRMSPAAANAAEKETEKSTPANSMFGGALSQKSAFSASPAAATGSAFGSSASGFGKLGQGSAFGSGAFGSLGGGSGLSSFANGKPSSSLAGPSKATKAFGAPADDDDEPEAVGEVEGDDSGIKSPLSQDSDKQDERFYEQDLETGEEDETTEYSCRAKLYNFAVLADGKKEWKERGLGVVRVNVKKDPPGEEDTRPSARLLMRAEGSHRVILNTAVKKEINFGAPDGGEPQGGYVYFMGAVDGKKTLELLQLNASLLS